MLEPSKLLLKQVTAMLQMCINWNPDFAVIHRHSYRHGGIYKYRGVCGGSVL